MFCGGGTRLQVFLAIIAFYSYSIARGKLGSLSLLAAIVWGDKYSFQNPKRRELYGLIQGITPQTIYLPQQTTPSLHIYG